MNRIFVYYKKRDHEYSEIEEEYLDSPEKCKKYFGWIEDDLDENNELVIYELVPYKTLIRDITFKFKE